MVLLGIASKGHLCRLLILCGSAVVVVGCPLSRVWVGYLRKSAAGGSVVELEIASKCHLCRLLITIM